MGFCFLSSLKRHSKRKQY